MTDRLLQALETILLASDAVTYLDAQDGALDNLRATPHAIWTAALGHSDPNLRWEALQLVSVSHADGHRRVLERALREDADPSIRECAQALLVRSAMRDNVAASSKLSPDAFSRYVRNVRESAARHLFESQE